MRLKQLLFFTKLADISIYSRCMDFSLVIMPSSKANSEFSSNIEYEFKSKTTIYYTTINRNIKSFFFDFFVSFYIVPISACCVYILRISYCIDTQGVCLHYMIVLWIMGRRVSRAIHPKKGHSVPCVPLLILESTITIC